jgi:flagellar protein FlbD
MILLTRLNHTPVVLNSELIEYIETTPDTVISLTNGEKFMVLESADDVISRVVQYRRRILPRPPTQCPEPLDDEIRTNGENGR